MRKKNEADKYKAEEDLINPENVAEMHKNSPKKFKLEYLVAKPGYCMAKSRRLLTKEETKVDIVGLDGSNLSATREEMIFEVLKVGKITSEYGMEVKRGDLIMAAVTGIHPIVHGPNTIAQVKVMNETKNVNGYYNINLEAIIAIVSYEKI